MLNLFFRSPRLIFSAWLIAMIALCSSLSFAQGTSGSIVGTVKDPSGNAVVDAIVTATRTETNLSRETKSDSRGEFTFAGMGPGTYSLKITANGFKSKQLDNLVLTSGATLPVTNADLQMGSVSETMIVSTEGAAVETSSSQRADLLSSKQIDTLVVRGRNFTDLVSLSPGVINTSKSTDISTNPSIYVNGNRSNSNGIFVDGVPSSDMSSTQMKGMVSQDSIQEVKIQTSNFQAEFGRQAGSNIVATTKSGTRDFHGLLSYFNRNEAYNANSYFNNLTGIARPRYRYNTITYNIGGPVYLPGFFNLRKEKLFFFWNQEFWPTKTSNAGQVTVPTALERQGDFSQTQTSAGALIAVNNPYANKTQFPGNRIPTAMQDPNGRALLNVFPLPNFTNTAVSKGAYNYVFQVPVSNPLRTDSLRVDYHPFSSDTISGTYKAFNVDATGARGIPDSGSQNWPMMVKTYYTHSTIATGGWQHIFTPNTLNEANFGFLQQIAGDNYDDSELNKIKRSTTGFNISQFYPGANPLNVLPNTSFGGVQNAAIVGIESRFPLVNYYRLYNFSDNVSYTHGQHNFKAGLYLERFTRFQKTQSGVNFNGLFDFGNNSNNPLDTGYSYSNALLGTFNSYKETSIPGFMDFSGNDYEFFLQDNWRITQKLTLDIGLRMNYVSPFSEATNQISGFFADQYNAQRRVALIAPVRVGSTRQGRDPGNGSLYPAAAIGAISPTVGDRNNGMVTGSSPGPYPNTLAPSAGLKYGPRAGFAYDVHGDGSMAIRGGFGIFQNRFQENYFDQLVAQQPIAQQPQVFYGTLSSYLGTAGLYFPNDVSGPDPRANLARVASYSLAVQQKIGYSTILDIAYVGTQGRHLQWFVDQNAIPLGTNFLPSSRDPSQTTSTPLPSAFLRPIVGYNQILKMSNGSNSSYNSLQVSAQRRYAKRLQFGVSYTWSKALAYSDTDSDIVNFAVPVRQYYRSLATYDRPQNLVVNYIYDLPEVPWKNLAADTFFNHWQLSGISTFQSGAPLGMTLSTTTGKDYTGSASITPRVQLTGNPNLSRSDRTFARYFNTSVVTLPAVGTTGNASRLFLRGPGINNFDMAMMKTFIFKERVNLKLRFEAYNVFNHTQWSTVNTSPLFNPTTGAITNAAFGQVTAARDPRQMQMSARITF